MKSGFGFSVFYQQNRKQVALMSGPLDVTGTQGEWPLNVEEWPPHPGRKQQGDCHTEE